jgi:hypothetical protein
MNAQRLEAFLAKLYVDENARRRFLADPRGESLSAGLSADECTAIERLDRTGLELAAESFARKRAAYRPGKFNLRFTAWLNRR